MRATKTQKVRAFNTTDFETKYYIFVIIYTEYSNNKKLLILIGDCVIRRDNELFLEEHPFNIFICSA